MTFGMGGGLINKAFQVNKIPRKVGLNVVESYIVPALPD
jgi:hypothetical protein